MLQLFIVLEEYELAEGNPLSVNVDEAFYSINEIKVRKLSVKNASKNSKNTPVTYQKKKTKISIFAEKEPPNSYKDLIDLDKKFSDRLNLLDLETSSKMVNFFLL